jgi:hypothetical protein
MRTRSFKLLTSYGQLVQSQPTAAALVCVYVYRHLLSLSSSLFNGDYFVPFFSFFFNSPLRLFFLVRYGSIL